MKPRAARAAALARHTTLRQLCIFEAAARLGSFTRAAEALHLSQPTVSMQMRRLADTIGAPLFESAAGRQRLTAIGREVQVTAHEVLRALADLESRIAATRGLERGHLRLAVITSAKYMAPHLLGRFLRFHPGIEASLAVSNRQQLLARIAAAEDDLYIFGEPPDELAAELHLTIPNPLVVMAARDHRLAGSRRVPLARLLSETLIMREPGSGTRAAMERVFEQHGLQIPIPRMTFGNNESIKQAIVAGLGISVLSLHSLALEGVAGPIAVLDVEGFPLERQWHLLHPAGRRPTVAASAFIGFAADEAPRIADRVARQLRRTRMPPA